MERMTRSFRPTLDSMKKEYGQIEQVDGCLQSKQGVRKTLQTLFAKSICRCRGTTRRALPVKKRKRITCHSKQVDLDDHSLAEESQISRPAIVFPKSPALERYM